MAHALWVDFTQGVFNFNRWSDGQLSHVCELCQHPKQIRKSSTSEKTSSWNQVNLAWKVCIPTRYLPNRGLLNRNSTVWKKNWYERPCDQSGRTKRNTFEEWQNSVWKTQQEVPGGLQIMTKLEFNKGQQQAAKNTRQNWSLCRSEKAWRNWML